MFVPPPLMFTVAGMAAALGVLGTGTAWPDLIVAGAMAVLALSGRVQIVRQARGELRLVRSEEAFA